MTALCLISMTTLVSRSLQVILWEAIGFTIEQFDKTKEHMQVSYLHLFPCF